MKKKLLAEVFALSLRAHMNSLGSLRGIKTASKAELACRAARHCRLARYVYLLGLYGSIPHWAS